MSRVRVSAGRGDFDNNTQILSASDGARYNSVKAGTAWDPRGDMDDDESVDTNDDWLFNSAVGYWNKGTAPTVAQAFSDVYNPFGFQGRVHLPFNTDWNYQDGELMLVDHRRRINDPVTGRWMTRDPIGYADGHNLYQFVASNPVSHADPTGLYESDVHFYMTYYYCRLCGLGPDAGVQEIHDGYDNGLSQAYIIAWADQMTDIHPWTEPLFPNWPGEPWRKTRSRFHFRLEPGQSGVKRNSPENNVFVNQGIGLSDPYLFGIGLHAFQDSWSHETYGPRLGHAMDNHDPDKPYLRPTKAIEMALATFEKIRLYKRKLDHIDPCSPDPIGCRPPDNFWELLTPGDDEMMRAWQWIGKSYQDFGGGIGMFSLDIPAPMYDSWAPRFISTAQLFYPTL